MTSSIFESLVARTRLPWNWFVVLLGLVFLVGGLGCAYVDGVLGQVWNGDVWRVLFVSAILMCGTIGLFLWQMKQGATIEHARTVAVNTLVMFEIFYLFNSRYITASVFNWKGLTGNRYVLLAIGILLGFQLGFTYLRPMQSLFGTTDLELNIWLPIVLVASSVLFLVELEKFFVRKMNRDS